MCVIKSKRRLDPNQVRATQSFNNAVNVHLLWCCALGSENQWWEKCSSALDKAESEEMVTRKFFPFRTMMKLFNCLTDIFFCCFCLISRYWSSCSESSSYQSCIIVFLYFFLQLLIYNIVLLIALITQIKTIWRKNNVAFSVCFNFIPTYTWS